MDGLRTFCVLATIATHSSPRWVSNGGVGVEIFFVLSGFLITNVLVSELANSGRLNLPRFYLRRFFRLMPAFWLLLAACTLYALFSHGIERKAQLTGVWISATYWMNWNKAFNITFDGILGHTWSLSVEEQFYLVLPFLLILLWRILPARHLWLAFLGLALISDAWRVHLALANRYGYRIYFSSETQAEMLLLGCSLAVAPALPSALRNLLVRLWPIPAIFLTLWTINRRAPIEFSDSLGYTLTAIGAVWLIYLLTWQPHFPVLSWAPITYLGRISYGIYLWHYPISQIVVRHYSGLRALALISFGGTGCAILSFHLVEQPLLRWHSRRAKARVPTPQSPVIPVLVQPDAAFTQTTVVTRSKSVAMR